MWSGGPVVRLSQTSPIPRSPYGDNKYKNTFIELQWGKWAAHKFQIQAAVSPRRKKKKVTEYLPKKNITKYLQKKNVTEFLQKRNITEYLQKRMSQRWSCFNALQLNCTSTAVLLCCQRKILQGTLLLSSSCSKSKFCPKLKQRCMSHCGTD